VSEGRKIITCKIKSINLDWLQLKPTGENNFCGTQDDVCMMEGAEETKEVKAQDGNEIQRPTKRMRGGDLLLASSTIPVNIETVTHPLCDEKQSDNKDVPSSLMFSFYDILATDLQSKEAKIKSFHSGAKPFPYAQIFDLFQPDFLKAVKEEIKTQASVSFKESDLFRVYQSIDFANLQPGSTQAAQFKHVMKVRELLYSQVWRSWMEELTGLPPSTLTSQIDCACNCHAPGCHLLCHDDVIGTRKISYIIYLTEPDWKSEEGGALELYEPQYDDTPQDKETESMTSSLPIPVKRAWPIFNSMSFFVVTPGSSFHAVQEVLGDRPRLSLQGWYHAKHPPPNMELATLHQLKSRDRRTELIQDTQSQRVVQSDDQLNVFTEGDREYLKKYVQPEFLSDESMNEIQQRFEQDSSAQLKNFLKSTWVPKMQPQKSFVYDQDYYSSSVSEEWKLQGPAHKQRYLRYIHEAEKSDDSCVVGSLLNHIKARVFESDAMKKYLGFITGLGKPTGINDSQIRHFRPGLDYTVAHHGLLVDEAVLDATLCFVYDENDDKNVWESGDVGGFECYIEADDDDNNNNKSNNNKESTNKSAADEYTDDDDGTELLSVSASNNTLSLVYRDPGTMRFVKYVGASAPSSRYDISMGYNVVADEKRD
jgi:prolyl 3-hydroxylase /prolyl 3,4-dihydroxylase